MSTRWLRRRRVAAPAQPAVSAPGPSDGSLPDACLSVSASSDPRSSDPRASGSAADETASHETVSGWTEDRIRALGSVTTVPIACAIFGVSPTAAYPKIRADLADGGHRFPVPVLQFGRVYRVPVPAILAALGATAPDPGPDPGPERGAGSVARADSDTDLISAPDIRAVGSDLPGRAQSRVDQPGRNPR